MIERSGNILTGRRERITERTFGPDIFGGGGGTGSGSAPVHQQLSNGGVRLCCPPGEHPNRTDYFLKNGTFVAKGTRCVRNRTVNPLNPKALNRSGRRLYRAKQAARFLQNVSVPKKLGVR